ncbi:lipopolysaccharide biosynthesis protein [Pedococcus sp. KACC 23699]|uniref:Lipopolysaccharide biosynthesis protein n=1 Tax=Pedococcus sp. KACC 23699 TaxID=3149228 RepID=A0AAU7JXS1_9MICO
MSTISGTAARGAGVTFAAQGARFVLQIGSLAVLSRLLTPSEVGIVAMVTAVLNVAEIVRDFGLSSAAIQAPRLSAAERTNLFWINLGIGTACSVVAAACAPLLGAVYGDPRIVPIVLALAWLFVVSGANTQYRADLSRSLRFSALALTDVAAQVLGIAVAIVCAVSGAGYWSIVAQQATFVVTTCLMNVAQVRWRPGRPRRDVPMRHFTRFGANLLGTNLLGYAVNNLDNVGIGAVWGSGPLGLYSRAYQLLQVPLQQVNAPLGRVVLPILSKVQDDPVRYERYFRRFQLVICYSLGLGFAVLAGLSQPIVAILFGPSWQGVAPLLGVLALSGVFKGIDSANYQMWVSRGFASQLFKFYLVSRPIMVVMILAGLPWGPLGVAVGQLVVAVLHWAVSLRIVCRLADIDARPLFAQSARALLLVILPAGLLAWVGTSLLSDPVASLATGTAMSVAWVAVAALVLPWVRRDLEPVVATSRSLAARR